MLASRRNGEQLHFANGGGRVRELGQRMTNKHLKETNNNPNAILSFKHWYHKLIKEKVEEEEAGAVGRR